MTVTKKRIGSMVEQRPGVFRLRVVVGYRPDGQPRQASETFHGTERQAEKALRDLGAKAAAGRITTSTHTVGTLLEKFIDHLASIGRSPTTLREYRRMSLKTITPELRKVKLPKLTASHLDTFYATLTEKGNAPPTVRRAHALISAALHQAEKWGEVDRNVAKQASPPPVQAVEPIAPSWQDVAAIIKTASELDPTDPKMPWVPQMFADLFTLAALTGARRGELCGLRWSDWDRDLGTLRIERSIFERPNVRKTGGDGWGVKDVKNHAGRTVTLDVSALVALNRRWDAATEWADTKSVVLPDDGYIFTTSPSGAAPVTPDRVTKFFAAAATGAGVDAHLHLLRHWAATQLIASGHDVVTVAKRLGHADPSVTLRVYSHALPQRDAAAADALGRILSGEKAALTN